MMIGIHAWRACLVTVLETGLLGGLLPRDVGDLCRGTVTSFKVLHVTCVGTAAIPTSQIIQENNKMAEV